MTALDNVITATITLYKIEEIAIYQSEIISTNGNIFHPYDVNTTLDFVVYLNNENVVDQFRFIEWSKFSHDANNVIEDKSWGEKHNGSRSITITKEDVDKKCVIQANAYSMVNNQKTCMASARITLVDVNELYADVFPPENPTDGSLWVNTSYSPPIIFSWNTKLNKWVEISKTTPFVRNLLHNSNFWKLNTEDYIEDNTEFLERITIDTRDNKKWAHIKSSRRTPSNASAGLMQTTTYPILKNSDYSFSCLIYKPDVYDNEALNVYCKIVSINDKGNTTNLITTLVPIETEQDVQVSIPFKTLEDTDSIRCFIGVEPKYFCEFYVTELSLYNCDNFYPWELSPEDTQKQLELKLDSDHNSVFNALTRNGEMEGIYINIDEDGKEHYYFNASHIKTGSIDGGLINGIGLDIKDEVTGDSIFHVYRDHNGTHIDMIANNLYIGEARETASTMSYVDTSMNTAIESAESYTNDKIAEVEMVVELKADQEGVDSDISTIVSMINGINNDIETNIKPSVDSNQIVNTVRSSQEYKSDLNAKVNVTDFNSYKSDQSSYLTTTFSSINNEINKKANDERVSGIESRVNSLESATTSSAIVAAVRNSQDYKSDLNKKLDSSSFDSFQSSVENQLLQKVNSNSIISSINSSSESTKINASKVAFNISNKIDSPYAGTVYTSDGIEAAPTSSDTTETTLDNLIDKIYFSNSELNLTMQVTDIKQTPYVKVSDDGANIYMNNNEIIKLLLYEIKSLRARINKLEGNNSGEGSDKPNE